MSVSVSVSERWVCDYCDGCGGVHEATYDHEGRWGEGPIYAVVCPWDGLTSYHTRDGVHARRERD